MTSQVRIIMYKNYYLSEVVFILQWVFRRKSGSGGRETLSEEAAWGREVHRDVIVSLREREAGGK